MNSKPRRKPEVDYAMLEYEFASPDTIRDDEDIYRLKEVISSLPPADKDILLLYLDEGSLRKAGKKIGVSPSLYYNQLQRVRENILNKFDPRRLIPDETIVY